MSALPDVYMGPAFVGWRSWRILPLERLGREPTVRLAASGTNGVPKMWEPRMSVVATCGKWETTHEAPWPGCECGLYAYRTRADAWEHLETFAKFNHDGVLGWAFGRVSLWGRIVECEYGYRGELAYPYALEVYAPTEIAVELRGVYGVDVESFEPLQPQTDDEPEEEHDDVPTQMRVLKERVDPSQYGLDQDVPLIQAIVSVGEGAGVRAGAAIAALPDEIRPKRSQIWSQAFARLDMRGWAKQSDREWTPTSLGKRVAQRGAPLIAWFNADAGDVLDELRLAVNDAGGPVSVVDIRWRFFGKWGTPSGHVVGQSLLRLEQRGLISRCGRAKGRILWRPSED